MTTRILAIAQLVPVCLLTPFAMLNILNDRNLEAFLI